MATYYIDYENVHNSGMKGIEEVGCKDLVYIFYSAAANTMTMDTIKKLIQSCCTIEFIEITNCSFNSLDFQLITLLYANIDSDDYHYIISNDKGYDASLIMAKKININTVSRFNSLYGAVKDYERYLAEYAAEHNAKEDGLVEQPAAEALADAEDDENKRIPSVVVVSSCETSLKPVNEIATYIQKLLEDESELVLSQEIIDVTCEGINKSSTKMELYKYLRHNLGDKDGRIIYGAVCDSWGELVVMAS